MTDKAEAQILIIEDDEAIRSTLEDALAEEGYRVETAANGREALRKLGAPTFSPRLILLDLKMPEMDGFAFSTEQKRNGSLARIPVVVLSADRVAVCEQKALGAAGYLLKPVQLDDLLRVVGSFCGPEAHS